MARCTLLHSLFDSDWFIGSNFDNWYQKLRIVLEHECILHIIMDPAPEVLTSNTYDAIKSTYQKWPNDHIIMLLRAAKNTNLVVNSMMLSGRKFFKCWRSSFAPLKMCLQCSNNSLRKKKKKKVQRVVLGLMSPNWQKSLRLT